MTTHIVPKRVYYHNAIALFVLLVLAIAANEVHLGRFALTVAMAIATTKAVLVVLFFMHVRYSRSLTLVAVVAGFLWLFFLLAGTISEVLTRGWYGERPVPFD